jgi:hypothetical protein
VRSSTRSTRRASPFALGLVDDREHVRVRDLEAVAHELRLRQVAGDGRERALVEDLVRDAAALAAAAALLAELGAEGVLVDLELALREEHPLQVERQAEGVVEQEGGAAGQALAAGALGLVGQHGQPLAAREESPANFSSSAAIVEAASARASRSSGQAPPSDCATTSASVCSQGLRRSPPRRWRSSIARRRILRTT